MTEIVTLERVEKRYGTRRPVHAIRGIDLTLSKGEPLVLVGPNGAGKSTLMRLLLGLSGPTSGEIRWVGGSRPRIGYAPERPSLPSHVTVRELLAQAHLGPPDNREDAVGAAVEALELGELLDRSTEALSKGQQQRVSLAFALSAEAPVVVMDEPFEGLDPLVRPLVRRFIATTARQTELLIVSTHRLEEVGAPFGRVIVLNRGEIVRDLSVSALREANKGRIVVSDGESDPSEVRAAFASSEKIVSVRGTFGDGPATIVGPIYGEDCPVLPVGWKMHPLTTDLLLQLWLKVPIE